MAMMDKGGNNSMIETMLMMQMMGNNQMSFPFMPNQSQKNRMKFMLLVCEDR